MLDWFRRIMFRLSILPIFLLLGVTSSRHLGNHNNVNTLQPIVTPSQARRICAALCNSGLGGRACGGDCLDHKPSSLPLQSVNSSRVHSSEAVVARTEICPVLCANNLGYPLCNCSTDNVTAADANINFVQICSNACINMNYRISGCQDCQVYKKSMEMEGTNTTFEVAANQITKGIDWDEWCRQMCMIGEGGVACNCDILPLRLDVH